MIRAHPYLNVFAATGRTLPPTNQYTEKFGIVPVLPNIKAISQELAGAVETAVKARGRTRKACLGLHPLLAWRGHGRRDLDDAYDTLERLEWSAQTVLLAEAAGWPIGPV